MTVQTRKFEDHTRDFAWCEDVIRRNSKSFYRAFSLLPSCKRNSVYALYTFCRAADDCVDHHKSEAMLDELEYDLTLFFEGRGPDQPFWRALDVVFESFDIYEQPLYDMIEGQRRDLYFQQPQTLEDLEEYGYYVAGSVGRMLLPILHANKPVSEELEKSAVDLGIAMQLTNILRDVGEDFNQGRVYLPVELMVEAGYTMAELEKRRASEAFVALWERIARRSEELYLPMQRDVTRLDGDSQLATISSLFLYRGILDQVRDEGYGCLTSRSVVPNERAYALVAEAERILGEHTVYALAERA